MSQGPTQGPAQEPTDAATASAVAAGELERLLAGARDALTDDTVTRLSATMGSGLDFLDRANRSGVWDALPTVAALVQSGDLQRIADLARLIGAAEDTLSDDIVGRLSGAAAGGLDLLDRINRSGIMQALPTISRMAESGDLDRLAGLARLVGAMEDSMSDDIVNRLALVATQLALLVDKLTRNPGFLRLIDLLGREEVQNGLIHFAEATCAAREAVAREPAPSGGLFGLLRIAGNPDTLRALQFVSAASAHLQKGKEG